MTDVIQRQIELKAPIARVWKALSDSKEFGEWFRVAVEEPFVPGKTVRGRILHPGYEHLTWEVTIRTMEPEKLFSFTWHPYAIDSNRDYSGEPATLVEFRLTPKGSGTLLTVIESGFDKLPKDRAFEAFRSNGEGWTIQMKNIERHVSA